MGYLLNPIIIRKNHFYIPCLFEFVLVLSGDVKFSLCMILVSINGSFLSLAEMLCFRNFFLRKLIKLYEYSAIQFVCINYKIISIPGDSIGSYEPYFLEDFISMPLL